MLSKVGRQGNACVDSTKVRQTGIDAVSGNHYNTKNIRFSANNVGNALWFNFEIIMILKITTFREHIYQLLEG